MREPTPCKSGLQLIRQEYRFAAEEIRSNPDLGMAERLGQLEALGREYRRRFHQELQTVKAQWEADRRGKDFE